MTARGNLNVNEKPHMSSNYRILVIAYAFPPSLGAEALCTGKVVAALVKKGFEVTVITADRPSQMTDGEFQSIIPPGVRLFPIRDPGLSSKRNFFTKLKRTMTLVSDAGSLWIKPALKFANEIINEEQFHVVYTRSLPGTSAIVGYKLRKYGLPFIAHFSDPWPAPDYFHFGTIRDLLSKLWFRRIARSADALSFTCEATMKYILKKIPRLKDKCFLATHIGHLMSVSADVIECSSREFRIVHCGSFTGRRTPFTLLDSFARFVSRFKDGNRVKLLFAGHSDWDIEEEVRRRGIENCVEALGPVGLQKAADMIRNASVLVIIEASQEEPLFLPSKFADYIQARKRILALTPKNSEISSLLDNRNVGLCVDPSDVVGCERALEDLYDMWINEIATEESDWTDVSEIFSEKVATRETVCRLKSLCERVNNFI
jgi:glycosyltransferase involved in cell wall biosynthesis